jgi:hypothetical protein
MCIGVASEDRARGACDASVPCVGLVRGLARVTGWLGYPREGTGALRGGGYVCVVRVYVMNAEGR